MERAGSRAKKKLSAAVCELGRTGILLRILRVVELVAYQAGRWANFEANQRLVSNAAIMPAELIDKRLTTNFAELADRRY